MLMSGIAITQFINVQPSEEEKALLAYAQFKETMTLVSENFNNGANHINQLNQFTETTNKIFRIENN